MTETLTIRLDAQQRRALRARARAAGITESALVRELIDGRVRARGTVGERAGRFFGCLDLAPASGDDDPWRKHLRRTNLRP